MSSSVVQRHRYSPCRPRAVPAEPSHNLDAIEHSPAAELRIAEGATTLAVCFMLTLSRGARRSGTYSLGKLGPIVAAVR
jgi:hypothetical protein